MKISFLFTFIFLVLQVSAYSQTLIDEYGEIYGHDEAARIDGMVSILRNKKPARLMFVIYTARSRERLGNMKGYIESVKSYLFDHNRGIDSSKVSFVVARGKSLFLRRVWLIEKGDPLPEFVKADFDYGVLKKTSLFAKTCLNCEGHVSDPETTRVDWKLLTEILKKNPEYRLRVEIKGNSAFGESGKTISAKKFFNRLRQEFYKKDGIEKKRIVLKRLKQNDEFGTIAKFYIVPNVKKGKRTL